VITLLNIETVKLNVIDKYKEMIQHRYLNDFIIDPEIDEDRLSLLLLFLHSQDLDVKEIENYSVSATLIQSALDIHEYVSNEPLEDHSHKVRQLTVLAGDYYSGLYYHLLAHIPNIQLIRKFAEGIKIINENKMSLYKKEYQSIGQVVNSIRLIESSILQKVSEYLKAPLWSSFINHYLFLKTMISKSSNKESFLREFIEIQISNDHVFEPYILNAYTELKSIKDQLSGIHHSLSDSLDLLMNKIEIQDSLILKKG